MFNKFSYKLANFTVNYSNLMKSKNRTYIIAFLLIIISSSKSIAQQNSLAYNVELNAGISSEETLPFWMTANKFGNIPNENYGLVKGALFKEFLNNENDFDISFKSSFLSSFSKEDSKVIIEELNLNLRYKNWILELGNKHDDILWEGLSSSNGNIIKSTNTRAVPGINLKTDGYIQLPFAKNWLTTNMNFAEHFLTDKRFVDNAQLHHKSLYLKSKLSDKLNLITGLEHYAIWGGTSETFGEQPNSFKDFIKVITGAAGNEESDPGEQINALGNHLGQYYIEFNYNGDNTNWNFYWSHLFEDRSGREMINYPDALYGLFLDLKQPEHIISHILFEYTHTKHMSGTEGFSGFDNYFNNRIYQSGWTYFGRTIGSPFFPTRETENGLTEGILGSHNRFSSVNIGLKGFINPTLSYKTNVSYTSYPGWFDTPINEKQLSGVFELFVNHHNLPFQLSVGAAVDSGDFLPNNVGGFVKLIKSGKF